VDEGRRALKLGMLDMKWKTEHEEAEDEVDMYEKEETCRRNKGIRVGAKGEAG